MADDVRVVIDDQIGANAPDASPGEMQTAFLQIVSAEPQDFVFFDAWSEKDRAYSDWAAVDFLSRISMPITSVIIDMVFGDDPLLGLRIADKKKKYKVLTACPTIIMTSRSRTTRVTWQGEERALGTVINTLDCRYLSKGCLSSARKFWSGVRRIEAEFGAGQHQV